MQEPENKAPLIYTVACPRCDERFYRYTAQLGAAIRRMGRIPLLVEASGQFINYARGFEAAPISGGKATLWMDGRMGYIQARHAGEALRLLAEEDLAFDTILFIPCDPLLPDAATWEWGEQALLLIRPDYEGVIEAYSLLKSLADRVPWVGLLCQADENPNMVKTVLENVVKTAAERLPANIKSLGLANGESAPGVILECIWVAMEWMGIYKETKQMPVTGLPQPLTTDNWVDFAVEGTKYYGKVVRVLPPDCFRVEVDAPQKALPVGKGTFEVYGGMFAFTCRLEAGWHETGRYLMELSVTSRAQKMERRSEMRLAVWLPVTVIADGRTLEGYTEDISAGGLRIVMEEPLEVNGMYQVRVHFDQNETVELTYRVVRVMPQGKSYRISMTYAEWGKVTDDRIIRQIFRLEVMRKGVVKPIE